MMEVIIVHFENRVESPLLVEYFTPFTFGSGLTKADVMGPAAPLLGPSVSLKLLNSVSRSTGLFVLQTLSLFPFLYKIDFFPNWESWIFHTRAPEQQPRENIGCVFLSLLIINHCYHRVKRKELTKHFLQR